MPRRSEKCSDHTARSSIARRRVSFFTRLALPALLMPFAVACSGLQTPDQTTAPEARTTSNGGASQSSSAAQNSREGAATPDAPVGSGTATSPAGASQTSPADEQTPAPSSPAPSAEATPTPVTRKQRGDGKLTRYNYTGPVPETPAGTKIRRVSFATEGGIGVDPQELAETALKILNDKRSWAGSGFTFVPVNENPHTTIIVASPVHSANLCRPLQTGGVLSCRKGNRVILTNYRWVNGHRDFKGDLDKYRTYLINHEVGHSLGHGHVNCPGKGKLAPVMMQQSKGTLGCIANGWVHPHNKN